MDCDIENLVMKDILDLFDQRKTLKKGEKANSKEFSQYKIGNYIRRGIKAAKEWEAHVQPMLHKQHQFDGRPYNKMSPTE